MSTDRYARQEPPEFEQSDPEPAIAYRHCAACGEEQHPDEVEMMGCVTLCAECYRARMQFQARRAADR